MKKMNTPRELYLECLDDNLGKTPIPSLCYKISMDSRMKAAQATINAFVKSYIKPGPKKIQVLVKIKLCLYQVFLH